MTFLAFCKMISLVYSVELGLIPGHDVSMYVVPKEQTMLNVGLTLYADFNTELKITKYAFVSGGLQAFSLAKKNEANMYPIRMDYTMGAGLRYGVLEAGWRHECYHPIAPSVKIVPFPRIDSSKDIFYIKAVITTDMKGN
jgi:hypothetical protein